MVAAGRMGETLSISIVFKTSSQTGFVRERGRAGWMGWDGTCLDQDLLMQSHSFRFSQIGLPAASYIHTNIHRQVTQIAYCIPFAFALRAGP